MVLNSQQVNDYLRKHRDTPFKWGEFDCCTFVCDVLVLMGGTDFAKDVRGAYRTEREAKKVLIKHFGGSVENAFSSLNEIDVRFVQRGDLVLFDTPKGKVMSVRWGEGYWTVSDGGLGVMIEIEKPLKCWRL